jgi:hypothetical protein
MDIIFGNRKQDSFLLKAQIMHKFYEATLRDMLFWLTHLVFIYISSTMGEIDEMRKFHNFQGLVPQGRLSCLKPRMMIFEFEHPWRLDPII